MDSSLINELDFEGRTPLSLSIINEKLFSCKALLARGASVHLGANEMGSVLNISVQKFQSYITFKLIFFKIH